MLLDSRYLTIPCYSHRMHIHTKQQRWNRGHTTRDQGHKMSEAKAKDSFSEDRLSRGQGHRRKCSPKKKDLQKKFFRQSSIHRRSQNFWFGGPKPQITCNDVIKNFRKRIFLWDKDIVGWKIWNRCLLALNQDFAKRECLNQMLKSANI